MQKKTVVKLIKICVAVLLIAYVATMIQWQDELQIPVGTEGEAARVPVRIHEIDDTFRFRIAETWEPPVAVVVPKDWQPGAEVSFAVDEFEKHYAYRLGFLSLIRFSSKNLLILFGLLHLCSYVFSFTRWYLLLKPVGVNAGYREIIAICWIGVFFNNILLSLVGGDVVKAFYICRKTDKKTMAVTTLFIDRMLGLLSIAILASIALLPNLGEEGYFEASLLVLFLVSFSSGLMIVFFVDPVRELVFHNKLISRLPFHAVIRNVAEAGRLFKNHKRVLVYGLLLSLGGNLAFIIVYWGYGMALGTTVMEFKDFLLVVPICQLIAAVPVAPAGWGLGEYGYTYFFGKMGERATLGAAVSITSKIVNIIVSMPGALFWAMRGKAYSQQAVSEFEAQLE